MDRGRYSAYHDLLTVAEAKDGDAQREDLLVHVGASMYSNISNCACSRVSNVLRCTHSRFRIPTRLSVGALSQGLATDPMEGLIPCSRIVLPGSSERYCEP